MWLYLFIYLFELFARRLMESFEAESSGGFCIKMY